MAKNFMDLCGEADDAAIARNPGQGALPASSLAMECAFPNIAIHGRVAPRHKGPKIFNLGGARPWARDAKFST